jgi:hypothetical protein
MKTESKAPIIDCVYCFIFFYVVSFFFIFACFGGWQMHMAPNSNASKHDRLDRSNVPLLREKVIKKYFQEIRASRLAGRRIRSLV